MMKSSETSTAKRRTFAPSKQIPLFVTGIILFPAGLCFAPAKAQTAAPAAAAPSAVSQQASDEILVTGYRFFDEDTSGTTNLPVPIEKVPQSITLLNGDFLKATDLKTLGEIGQYTTGGMFAGDNQPYGTYINLRGFKANYSLDGMPSGDLLTEPDVATIERLEVVKGPSSVVYGASSPGGLINLVSKGAAAGTPSYVSVLGGSWGRWRLEGQVAGALNASGSLRAIGIGAHEEAGSYIHELKSSKSVAYAGLDFDAGGGVSAYVRGTYQKWERTSNSGIPAYSNGMLPDVGRSFFIGDKGMVTDVEVVRINGGLTWEVSPLWSFDVMSLYQETRRHGTNAYASSLTNSGTIAISEVKYNNWATYDFGAALLTTYKLDQLNLKDSFVIASVRYQWYNYDYSTKGISGSTDFFSGEAAIDSYIRGLNAGIEARPNSTNDQRLRYLTGSVQSVIQLARSLSLLGGLSYSSSPEVKTRTVANGAFTNYNPKSQISYRAALNFEPTQGLNLYGSYSESFQPQLRIDIDNNVLPPTTGSQYELGVKYLTLNRRLLITGAAYQLSQSNLQFFDRLGPDGGGRYKAIGKVRHRGVELEATGQITRNWQVKGGVSLIDPVIIRDADATIIGKTRTWIPKRTANIYTSYTWSNGIFLGGGARYLSSAKTSYTGATVDLPGYTLFDASVGYVKDKWSVQVNLKNLADKTYYTNYWQTYDYAMYPGEPRSVTVSVRRNF